MKTIDMQERPFTDVIGNQLAARAGTSCARKFSGSDLVECLSVSHLCRWGVTFGDSMFCSHPSKNLLTEGARFKDCPATLSPS